MLVKGVVEIDDILEEVLQPQAVLILKWGDKDMKTSQYGNAHKNP